MLFQLDGSTSKSGKKELDSDSIVWFFIIFVLTFLFWSLFATFVENFYRDDNVGGLAPVISAIADNLLAGKSLGHTYCLGGGGGAYLSLALTGALDPFVMLPAGILPSIFTHKIVQGFNYALKC